MALPKVKRNPPYIESTLKLFFLFGIKFRFTKNGVEDFRGPTSQEHSLNPPKNQWVYSLKSRAYRFSGYRDLKLQTDIVLLCILEWSFYKSFEYITHRWEYYFMESGVELEVVGVSLSLWNLFHCFYISILHGWAKITPIFILYVHKQILILQLRGL